MIPTTFDHLQSTFGAHSGNLVVAEEMSGYERAGQHQLDSHFVFESSCHEEFNFDQPQQPSLFDFTENDKDDQMDFCLSSVEINCIVCKNQECSCFSEFENEDKISDPSDSVHPQPGAQVVDTKLIIPKHEFCYELPMRVTSQNAINNNYEKPQNSFSTKNMDSTMKDTEEDQKSNVEKKVAVPRKHSSNSKSKAESNLFLVRRACFRGFSEYFKNKFAASNYSWQRKRGNKKKKTPMMELIRDFAEAEFGSIVTNLSEAQWKIFRTTLFTVMFSHRYKKSDEFLTGIDFTEIRNVLYHYTTESRNEFLKNPQFCFLLHHFFIQDRTNFLDAKIKEKSKLNMSHLKFELSVLDEEALMTLQKRSLF